MINFGSSFNFHANTVLLTGGLTPDDVLWNFYGGNSGTLSGGPTMDINANTSSSSANVLAGVFLDPYGTVSVDNTSLNGRVFGGDSQNEQLVSGEYIDAPPPPGVPDAGGSLLLLSLGMGLIVAAKKRLVA